MYVLIAQGSKLSRRWIFAIISSELQQFQAKRLCSISNLLLISYALLLMFLSEFTAWKYWTDEKDESSGQEGYNISRTVGGKLFFCIYLSWIYWTIWHVKVIHLYKTFVMVKKEDLSKEIRDKKWTSVGGVSQISVDDILHL